MKKYFSFFLAITIITSNITTTVFAQELNNTTQNTKTVTMTDREYSEYLYYLKIGEKPTEEGAITQPIVSTTPPEIGTTLGNIYDENGELTELYKGHSIGVCVGYVMARFEELHEIKLPYLESPRNWIKNEHNSLQTKAILDLDDIQEKAIAVYAPIDELSTAAGHVVIIEYIERDVNENPINIYYTDSNGGNDIKKGEFNKGYDGIVKKRSMEEFKNPLNGLKLIGYIVPDKTSEKQETSEFKIVDGYLDVTDMIDPITGKVDPNFKLPHGSYPTISYIKMGN